MLLFCFVWVLSCRGLRTLLEADYHTLPWKRRSLCSRTKDVTPSLCNRRLHRISSKASPAETITLEELYTFTSSVSVQRHHLPLKVVSYQKLIY